MTKIILNVVKIQKKAQPKLILNYDSFISHIIPQRSSYSQSSKDPFRPYTFHRISTVLRHEISGHRNLFVSFFKFQLNNSTGFN